VAVRLINFVPRLTWIGGNNEEEVGEVSLFIELSKGDSLFELPNTPLNGFIGIRLIKEELVVGPAVLFKGVLLLV